MSDPLAEYLASLSDEARAALRANVAADAWRAGDLRYKLHAKQKELRAAHRARNSKVEVLEIGRQWGKTRFLINEAAEECLKNPGCRVVYGAPSLKHLEEFILPALGAVAEDAPSDCRPVYEPSKGHWTFPNGSYVHLFGADDTRKADRGRGPGARLAIFDEAGFTPILKYVLSSIFQAQLLHTQGRMILSSSPAPTPDHDFTAIAEQAEAEGHYARYSLYENPLLTEQQVEEFIAGAAKLLGYSVEDYKRTSEFRREFLAQRVVDATLLITGDDWLGDHGMRETALVEVERPQFFDAYEVIDWGGADPRAALFGYYDFANARLVIEDELNLRNNENTEELANAVKAKESELWGINKWEGSLKAIVEEKLDDRLANMMPRDEVRRIREKIAAPVQPYLRVCDHDTQTAIDFYTLHKLAVVPAEKTEVRLVANEFRVALRQGRVVIDPRCRDLDRQLRTGEWATIRATDFKRKNGEHWDLGWCAIHMWRAVRQGRNPVPPMLNFKHDDMHTRQRPKVNPLRAVATGGLRRIR